MRCCSSLKVISSGTNEWEISPVGVVNNQGFLRLDFAELKRLVRIVVDGVIDHGVRGRAKPADGKRREDAKFTNFHERFAPFSRRPPSTVSTQVIALASELRNV